MCAWHVCRYMWHSPRVEVREQLCPVTSSIFMCISGVKLMFERNQVARFTSQALSPEAPSLCPSFLCIDWFDFSIWCGVHNNCLHFANNIFPWLYLKCSKPIWTYNKSYHSLNAAWVWGKVEMAQRLKMLAAFREGVCSVPSIISGGSQAPITPCPVGSDAPEGTRIHGIYSQT